MEDAEGFDRVENGMVALRLETWAGFVFLTFNKDAPPLIDHLGDMPRWFASHKLEDMRFTWAITLEPHCNWKLILENAMETYHTGIVHKATVGAQTSRTIETQGAWKCLQVISGRSIATLPGAPPPFPPICGLDDEAKKGTYFTVIHPACQFAVAQDCLWWLNVLRLHMTGPGSKSARAFQRTSSRAKTSRRPPRHTTSASRRSVARMSVFWKSSRTHCRPCCTGPAPCRGATTMCRWSAPGCWID
jgi:phenylpropionate dioxygenase-like ring-hydroxylating dioxygenase large terminal subunit